MSEIAGIFGSLFLVGLITPQENESERHLHILPLLPAIKGAFAGIVIYLLSLPMIFGFGISPMGTSELLGLITITGGLGIFAYWYPTGIIPAKIEAIKVRVSIL